jgi:2-C-methyl-D-erythritol 4-phosphate cytidylyltransferase/2-C-methyl-D-erythritol 2,4-cyclodiphosphate synthase
MNAEGRKEHPGTVGVVIVAAGRGERAGTGRGPKQYRPVGGVPVIARTLDVFLDHPRIGPVVVVIHPDDHDLFAEAVGARRTRVSVVEGGPSRQQSTVKGLAVLSHEAPEVVLIHDAVRPFVDHGLLDRVIAAVGADTGALPSMPVSDTLKRSSADGQVVATVPRDGLHSAQTPQAFPFTAILDAHRRADASGRTDFTDDCSIAEWAGLRIALVRGSADNVKLTWPEDLAAADAKLFATRPSFPDVRTGNGYDVHAFGPGDRVTLCGVAIAYGRGLSGHSDADVGLHALTDALLATCGAGDIGTHFPPSDQRWKGASSRLFVEHAVAIVRAAGGRIAHADVTLICEAPKVGPHRAAMMQAMADMLGIAPSRVSVKATTNERLGFVGREEGIAAIATATVVFPGEVPA